MGLAACVILRVCIQAPNRKRRSLSRCSHPREIGFLSSANPSRPCSARTSTDFELIVVDDASSDGTAERLASVDDPRLRWFRNPARLERAVSRNAALAHSRGAWILCLDDDDILVPGALRSLSSAARSYPGIVGVVGRLRYSHPGRIVDELWVCRRWTGDLLRDSALGPILGVDRAILSAAAIRLVGGWRRQEEVPCEDYGLALRLAAVGRATVIPDVVAIVRVHEDDPKSATTQINRIRETFMSGLPPRERRAFARRLAAHRRLTSGVTASQEEPLSWPRALLTVASNADLVRTPLARIWLLPAAWHGLPEGRLRRAARWCWRRARVSIVSDS